MTSPIPSRWLALALVACAALAIASAPWALDAPVLNFVFKPLATLIVIAHAWQRGHNAPVVRRWVLAGLVFSLGGDVALLWPQQGFLPGLVSFLLAHLAYLVAFTRSSGWRPGRRPSSATRWWRASCCGGCGRACRQRCKLPVVAYVVCLAAMAAQAAVLWRRGSPRGAVLALGGALFLASDALLATNKFAGPLPLAGLWILATYWAAQWCIASWLKPR